MLATAISRRALIVEDDKSGCEVLMKVLGKLGHTVDCASTVHVALRKLTSFQPTHILLDLMLPDGNGAEVLEQIRKDNLPIKVAVITAVSEGRFWEEAVRHRPDVIFRKPWNLEQIKNWLVEVDPE
jgi:CheY-like chemotaxis protein